MFTVFHCDSFYIDMFIFLLPPMLVSLVSLPLLSVESFTILLTAGVEKPTINLHFCMTQGQCMKQKWTIISILTFITS